MIVNKIAIGKRYIFGNWDVIVIRIDEPNAKWSFRRVWYSKDGDAGEPFFINEEIFLSLGSDFLVESGWGR